MAAKCPSCNKFASLDFGDPEEDGFEHDSLTFDPVDGSLSGTITASVHIVRTSACCGDDMKEATLELSSDVSIPHAELVDHIVRNKAGAWAWEKGHGLDVEHEDPEQVEEGGGRYTKSYFGASIAYTINCACGKELCDGEMTDKVAASEMDELT